MHYRNGNYAAFYVDEPFSPTNLGANAAPDFCFYRQLQAWKASDPSFPFADSHQKTYSVRDGSDWELTLKPRLHQRLLDSKNIILFLSSHTRSSRALEEEIRYGVGVLGLPLIIVYTEFDPRTLSGGLDPRTALFVHAISGLAECMREVPRVDIPFKKDVIRRALLDPDLMVQSKISPGRYLV